MQNQRMLGHRMQWPDGGSGERDAWYLRPHHDNLAPQGFFDLRVCQPTISPETALMYAVLEDALICLQKKAVDLPPRVRRRARDAERWFLSNDSRWIFSFLSICDALGLDPAYLRKKVRHWRPTVEGDFKAKRK